MEKWDGPRTLHEMFDIKDERILKYISDYKLNLIEPAMIDNTEKFRSDFKYVVDFIKNSKNKKKLEELVDDNSEYFSRVPHDTAMLIKYCVDVDVRVTKKEEETNMCKAIEDMKEDAREEVRQQMQKEIERVKREKEEMCKAIEDMKEDAREEVRQQMQKEIERAKREKEERCKAIEDMKEDAREEVRLEIAKNFLTAMELHNKNLISMDNVMEMLKLPTKQFNNAVNEITLKKW